jgi:ferric-dicitrate binding protein FerR (iron transport regulator)
MARTLNGEATDQQQDELFETLSRDEELNRQYEILRRIWADKTPVNPVYDPISGHTIVHKAISKIITQAELERISSGYELTGKRSFIRKRRVLMGSIAFLVIALVIWIWKYQVSTSGDVLEKKETIAAQNGSRTRALLPDGSAVWLNAGSKLYYDGEFSGTNREVSLEGEAFFDIVKKTDHPFIVHTSGIDIKVLGTAFNVKSYPEDKTVETTLYRGQVEVFRHEDSAKTVVDLKPNEKLIWLKQAAIETVSLSEKRNQPQQEASAAYTIAYIDSTKKEDQRIETAWVYSRLEFHEDSFEELAKKIERWYNVTIVFTDEKVRQLKVTGSFEKETIEQVFVALKTGFPISYKINNHEIFVGSSE